MGPMRTCSLAEMKLGEGGRVVGIRGGQGLVRRLNSLGVRVGSRIVKVGGVFGRGPVAIRMNGFEVAVGYGIAVRVLVEVEDDVKGGAGREPERR